MSLHVFLIYFRRTWTITSHHTLNKYNQSFNKVPFRIEFSLTCSSIKSLLISEEHWLGNKFLHAMTSAYPQEMRIELGDWEGNRVYAKYSTFKWTLSTTNSSFTLVLTQELQGEARSEIPILCKMNRRFPQLIRITIYRQARVPRCIRQGSGIERVAMLFWTAPMYTPVQSVDGRASFGTIGRELLTA